MTKYIVTPLEIAEANDAEAITKAVKFIRDYADSSEITTRFAGPAFDEDGNESGKYEVCADNSGQDRYVTESVKIAGPFNTESEADAEADKLNAGVDGWIRSHILNDYIELPGVTRLWMGSVTTGMYPQSRNVTVDVEVGDISFEIVVFWKANEIVDRDINTYEVAKQVTADFAESLAKAQAAKLAEEQE